MFEYILDILQLLIKIIPDSTFVRYILFHISDNTVPTCNIKGIYSVIDSQRD